MDGVLIQNNNELLNYDAKDIKSIRVINTPYRYGPAIFSGIISVETYKGDFMSVLSQEVMQMDFPSVEPSKITFNLYSNNYDISKIPDYRTQLLWKPNFHPQPEQPISFYTSQAVGIYEISLHGSDEFGMPVIEKSYIKVHSE